MASPLSTEVTPTTPVSERSSDLIQAIRNGLKLGGSLAGTWMIALIIRLWLPRALGPDRFGQLTFAETLTTACFVVLALGLDTYIRKEIPVRPEHASDFFATVCGIRIAVFALLTTALWAGLTLLHQSPQTRALVLAFAFAQLLQSMENSLAALLQAKGSVGGLSVVNVASKLLWGGGVTAVLLTGAPLVLVPGVLACAEAIKGIALFALARKHLHLRLRWEGAAARRVMKDSLPFYLALVAQTVFANVDVTVLSAYASSTEVGWFGGAESIANLALFATPLLTWVLMPLMARAHARSKEELFETARGGLGWLFTVTTPVTLAIALGAPLWLRIAFGRAYLPAADALRVFAPMFVLDYISMLLATTLIMLERPWIVTWISLAGVVVDPLLNALLVPRTLAWIGTGGGGVACAAAHLITEGLTAMTLLGFIGREAIDRALLGRAARTVLVCLAVIVLDRALGGAAPTRLLIDAGAYVALAWLIGAISRSDVEPVLRAVRSRARRASAG